MDHLPLPTNQAKPNIVIPHLRGEYDRGEFFGYPQRQGYVYDKNGFICWDDQTQDIVKLQFYQTWLYYGLMFAVFGFPVDTADLIRPCLDNSAPQVDSKKLNCLIDNWVVRLMGERRVGSTTIMSHARLCLSCAIAHCDWLDLHPVEARTSERWNEVILSIKVLICSLKAPLSLLEDPRKPPLGQVMPWSQSSNTLFPSASKIGLHMTANGWCPFRTRYILSQFCYNTVYYLACLPRNRARKAKHNSCLKKGRCVGDSVDSQKPFKCLHTENCNGCPFISPPIEKILSILEDGEIPVIVRTRGTQPQWDLDVVKAGPNISYTAITHVWADGLGMTSSLVYQISSKEAEIT